MPKINFHFRGYIQGAVVEYAKDKDGNVVDVSQMDVFELLQKIDGRELFIDPYHFILNNLCDKWKVEDFDWARTRE